MWLHEAHFPALMSLPSPPHLRLSTRSLQLFQSTRILTSKEACMTCPTHINQENNPCLEPEVVENDKCLTIQPCIDMRPEAF